MDIPYRLIALVILLSSPTVVSAQPSSCTPARLYHSATDYLNNCYEELDHFEWRSEWGNGEFIIEAGAHMAVLHPSQVFGIMQDNVLIRPTAGGRSLAYMVVKGPLTCYVDQLTDIYHFINEPFNQYSIHAKQGCLVKDLAYISSHDTGLIYSIDDIDTFISCYPRFKRKINLLYKYKPVDMQFIVLWKTALRSGGVQMPMRGVIRRKWRSEVMDFTPGKPF